LADPELGAAFDALTGKLGHGGSAVDYRLAALHLRKNIRSRRGDEGKKLADYGVNDLTQRWRPVGAITRMAASDVPTEEGIFALLEPNRFLFLTRHPNMREGVAQLSDPTVLTAMGNQFWTPSTESLSL